MEIDDFGSGYSSLNMISNVPLDALKLDMGFMQNAFKDRRNAKMLDAVIGIASSLEVPSIAEGVETAEQMFVLKEMGCDMVQGYYFSRPVPPEIYEQFLLDRKYALLTGGAGSSRGDFIKAPEQFAYEALHDPATSPFCSPRWTTMKRSEVSAETRRRTESCSGLPMCCGTVSVR